jgi:hypothetical protein
MKFKKPAFPYIIVLVSIVSFSVFSENILLNMTQNNLVFQVGKSKTEFPNKAFDKEAHSIVFKENKKSVLHGKCIRKGKYRYF